MWMIFLSVVVESFVNLLYMYLLCSLFSVFSNVATVSVKLSRFDLDVFVSVLLIFFVFVLMVVMSVMSIDDLILCVCVVLLLSGMVMSVVGLSGDVGGVAFVVDCLVVNVVLSF